MFTSILFMYDRMAQAQLTNLTWKLSPDNLRRMLHDMRGRSDFTDVTLVCDDDALVEAHKVVLGAVSPVFRKMLASNHLLYPGSHPMIYLRGVKHQDMEAILRYIYLGEPTVHQDRIKNVLDAAKEFGIKELSNNNNENLQSPKNKADQPKPSYPIDQQNKKHQHQAIQSLSKDKITNSSHQKIFIRKHLI